MRLTSATVVGYAVGAVLLISSNCEGEDSPVPSFEEIRTRLHKSRDNLPATMIQIDGEYGSGETRRQFRDTLYWTAERWRVDVSRPYRGAAPAGGPDVFTEVTCLGCVDPGRIVVWSNEILQNAGGVAVSVYRPEDVPESDRKPLVDPTDFALLPETAAGSSSASIEELWGDANREPGSESVASTVEEDRKLWRVSWKHRRGFSVQYWISAEQGYGVVRIILQRENNRKTYNARLKQSEGVDQRWWPEHYRLDEESDGRRIRWEEATVAVMAITAAAMPEIWSLSSFEGLKPGTSVIYHDRPQQPGGRKVWDGRTVTSRGQFQIRADPGRDSHKSPSRKWMIWVNVAVLFLVGALYFWRRQRAS